MPRTISMPVSIVYFIISIIINSLGNVLTLVTSAKVFPHFLGSAYWTAAETNLSIAIHWDLFWTFVLVGIIIIILNAILIGKWDWGRAVGNLIFMIPFSWLVQVFYDLFTQIIRLPDAHTPLLIMVYVLVNFMGVALIGIAISIYQRVNLVLHPNDDLMQISISRVTLLKQCGLPTFLLRLLKSLLFSSLIRSNTTGLGRSLPSYFREVSRELPIDWFSQD